MGSTHGRAARLGPATLLLLAPALLAGCNMWDIKAPAPRTLGAEPDKPLVVPPATDPEKLDRFVSALPRLRVRPARGDHLVWHSLPGTSDWTTAEREGDSPIGAIDLAREGVHLLSTAPAGSFPYRASVEVVVDRSAPSLEARFERMRDSSQAGKHFRLRWRADDPQIAGQGVRLEWRDPADGTWQIIAGELPPAGAMLWPYPAGELSAHSIRLTAKDLAGNESQVEVPLGEAFDRPKWVADALPRAGAPPPAGAPAPAPSPAREGGTARAAGGVAPAVGMTAGTAGAW